MSTNWCFPLLRSVQENKESPTTADPNLAQDPYASFLAEQRQREIKWATDREAKRTRQELNEHAVEIRSLKEQLQAKNRECDLLKNQLEDVRKTNAVAMENRRNEDLAY